MINLNIWPEIAALIAASLILISSLAWDEAVRTWFFSLGLGQTLLQEKVLYAIFVTFISGIILAVIKPFRHEGLRQEP